MHQRNCKTPEYSFLYLARVVGVIVVVVGVVVVVVIVDVVVVVSGVEANYYMS